MVGEEKKKSETAEYLAESTSILDEPNGVPGN